MLSYILFLRTLLAHADRLQALLGDQWPLFKVRLDGLLNELLSESNEKALPARVNRIYRSFEGTPAEPLVRALLQQAVAQAQELDPGAWSVNVRDPATLETRSVDLRAATQPPGAPHKALVASAEELSAIALELVQAVTRPAPETERRVNVWIDERIQDPARPLAIGDRYTLSLGVGKELAGSLIAGRNAIIPGKIVGGLQTEWVVSSSAFELASNDSNVVVTAGPSQLWNATFQLLIPEQGESEVRRLLIVPRSLETPRLEVLIFAVRAAPRCQRELYRRFTIDVPVEPAVTTGVPTSTTAIRNELVFAPGVQMNLLTRHEWTTPRGRLKVIVEPGALKAFVDDDTPGREFHEHVDWYAQPARLAGLIDKARDAAEKFRGAWEQYLNDIDPQDLLQRLKNFKPTYNWRAWKNRADSRHTSSWVSASTSQQLRDLAIYGHELYEAVFGSPPQLGALMASLDPGHLVEIFWDESSGPGYVPNVPWGLMYLPDPPAMGQAVDPLGFLALRFRIGYWGYRVVSGSSKDLGSITNAHQAYCLYWGSHPNDDAGSEAAWQRQQLQGVPNQMLIPQTPGSPSSRAEVLQALTAPPVSPTSVIYFFCHAAVGAGNAPVLRFGPTSGPTDVLQTTDLLGKPLIDKPFVFANACTTSAADPYIANLLEQSLFRRGCRGFVGTETKVPIQLASRIAMIFFNFFYGRVDQALIAAGEALAQTRLFLLTEYVNIGGIFYTYLNQYELYMADYATVSGLRA